MATELASARTPANVSATLDDLVEGWLRALRRQGRSDETERSYRQRLAGFIAFVETEYGIIDASALRRQHIDAWHDHLAERGIKPAGRSQASTALRKWLQWMAINDHPVQQNLWLAVPSVKVPRALPRPLEAEHLSRLLRTMNHLIPPGPTLKQLRDRALILYLLSTGARISEVLQVDRTQLEKATVWRKGQREGILYPTRLALKAVEDYLDARTDPLPFLWVSLVRDRASGRLSPEGVRLICRQAAKRAGIPSFTPHQLRHSTASIAYDETGDALAAANHLGHAGLETIQTYAKVSDRRRESVLQAVDQILRQLARDDER